MTAPLEQHEQRDRLQPACRRQSERDPDMRPELHEHQGEDQIGRHCRDRDFDRGRGVVVREKARRQHFAQHKGRQPDCVSGERRRGRLGVGGPKGAALEQDRHDRMRQHDKGCCSRQGQQQRQFDAAVLRRGRAGQIAGAHLARQRRQDRRRDGDPDNPQRQLVEPVGVIEVRHRPARQ